MQHEEHNSNIIEGLLIGGLIGVAVGIMFAPFSGDKTRAVLKKKLTELGFDGVLERFSEAFEEAKKEAAKVEDEVGQGE